MKTKIFIGIMLLGAVAEGKAQIVTTTSSLPEAGDVLQYKTIDNLTDVYLTSGEAVEWDFSNLEGEVITEEEYMSSDQGANFDQFPDTDILLTLAGAEAYANRNTTNIEVVGIAGGQFLEGVELAEAQDLSEPYVIRRAPLGYGDTYSGSSTFNFRIAIEALGPLADVIDSVNPFEGVTVDSIGVTITLNRSEEVDSYGSILLGGQSIDVLRLVQSDQTEVAVEVSAVVPLFGNTWISISDLIDVGELGFDNQVTTNYIFLDETSKEHLVEVNVNEGLQLATGKYNADFTNSLSELSSKSVQTYPNPVNDVLFIENGAFKSVLVINSVGQIVLSKTLNKSGLITLDLSELTSGVYMLNLTNKKGVTESHQIIKK